MTHIPTPHKKCNVCSNVVSCNTRRLINLLYPYYAVFEMSMVWRIGSKIWREDKKGYSVYEGKA